MSLVAAFLILAQVGPFTPSGVGGNASPLPPELQNRKPRREVAAPELPPLPQAAPGKASECMKSVAADPTAAVESAEAWRDGARDVERAAADFCLGTALSQLQRWTEAEAAFLDGRNAADGAPALRARLGAMAGSAALAMAAPDRALGFLDTAQADLAGDRTGQLPVDIALDRSRALVALKRLPAAAEALAEARSLAPNDAEVWLLSATLSRRMDKLAEAQTQIERAVQLLPVDPEIGLEAGVIAVMSGRDEAARKSWQSVIAAAPESPAAQTAKGYIAQLGAAKP